MGEFCVVTLQFLLGNPRLGVSHSSNSCCLLLFYLGICWSYWAAGVVWCEFGRRTRSTGFLFSLPKVKRLKEDHDLSLKHFVTLREQVNIRSTNFALLSMITQRTDDKFFPGTPSCGYAEVTSVNSNFVRNSILWLLWLQRTKGLDLNFCNRLSSFLLATATLVSTL